MITLTSYIGRKPHGIKKIFRKVIFYFSNDRWRELFFYIITEALNNFPFVVLKFYKKKKCPICEFEANNFIHLSNSVEISWNSACPRCDSRSRHRGLFFVYKKYIKNNKIKILHFAPESILSPLFTGENHSYYTTDLYMENVSYPNEDIQKLSFSDASFNLILCNHVLEHVEDDEKAVKEVSRILMKNGIAIITIPGNWKSEKTISQNPYYNNGHYRHYGLGIIRLLRKNFKNVKKINMHRYNLNLYAIKKMEVAFICEK